MTKEPAPNSLASPALTPPAAPRLGHSALAEINVTAPEPSIDIEVRAIAPAVYAPAEATPYVDPAKRGLEIQDSDHQAERATQYAEEIFPDSNFMFLGSGRYGIVLADETGKAFKVYRSAKHYSTYEREVGALQLLSEAGLAPRVHLFVDAGREYRLDRKYMDYTKQGFEKVEIPRQDSGRELPVLVMDRVDHAPLETAEPEKLADGFCRAADLFLRENISAWDCEVEVDRRTGDVIFLDVGGLSQIPFDPESATPAKRAEHETRILRNLALDFGLSDIDHQLITTYREGGFDRVRELIVGAPQPQHA